MAQSQAAQPTRRDFLYIATGAFGAVGAAAAVWPLIDQMNPSASVLALSSIEVDLAPIMPGQQITVTWRSHPLFVRRRTQKEIDESLAVPIADLLDPIARNANLPPDAPATDQNRLTGAPSPGSAKPVEKPEWLVVVGVCTHLGCTPTAFQGDYGGWLCHCHGSQYDTSGRVRHGPAPQNLAIPPFQFLSDTRVKVG